MTKIEINVRDKKEIFDIDYVAKQSNGAVLMRSGKSVILATITMEDEPVDGDFVPLTVQYIEKTYSTGQIPQGFIKRETKPTDFETLTSRIVDRSIRPLFPKGYVFPTQITILVFSADKDTDLQTMALNSAAVAVYISDIPIEKAVCGVRVGKINGKLIANPKDSEIEKKSSLDLFIAGTKEQLLMIEMRSISTIGTEVVMGDFIMDASVAGGSNLISTQNSNELNDDEMLEAINFASDYIKEKSEAYEKAFKDVKKESAVLEYRDEKYNKDLYIYIDEFYKDDVKKAVYAMAKSERASELKAIVNRILEDSVAKEQEWDKELISKVMDKYKKKIVRDMILDFRIRADGRALDEVRDISIETNILPLAHGSCLFTRGQTQALVTATLGTNQDAQMYNKLTEKTPLYDKFMVNYNFPGFSVGEASPLRAPGRRELGHGNLAKRALASTIDKNELNTIRLVSEVLESNGSSSMATVCGGSLAMRAAGVNSSALIAGVAMGLVIEDEQYAILTDIMGLEDHDGDMDFKVAGNSNGITAMQMDIKLGGISMDIIKEALAQSYEARRHILAIMEDANSKIVLNEDILPSNEIFNVHPSKIVDIIGQAGKTIRELIERFEVAIDLDRDKGEVKITGDNKKKVQNAKTEIIQITQQDNGRGRGGGRPQFKQTPQYARNKEFTGMVKRVATFGAFVELEKDVDGMIHISKLSKKRINKVEDVVNIGDSVRVKLIAQKGHKIELELIKKL